ncbi:hypothetical protein [Quadrisphaera sp. DSM 44207]|uniref:hypothetical protein n=1 Tax=Quadrisphaera sp. DSM 44207 TaxID=1881057 RepID=UPI00088F4001|nr:hypothetical protein [Quadrisphaera sp. DSM 44207]SDQ72252.1 hypothetical protein SAMN05428996_2544 [Quadrisphaera sp. DSM 44207]
MRALTAGVGTGKVLASLAAVTMVSVAGVAGTTAALSDTTANEGNRISAATIALTDNDAGTFMYQVDKAQVSDPAVERCIRVSYSGSLDSTVKLFMASTLDSGAPYVDLKVEAGTQASSSFPSCTGFTPAAVLYNGTLAGFRTSHGSAATGVAYTPNGANPWTSGNSVVYRVTVRVNNDARPAGADSSGLHTYTWQADTVV